MNPIISLAEIASTTEPFELDVGHYHVEVTGDFGGGGAAVLERRVEVHDGRELYDFPQGLPVFSADIGEGDFEVRPNSCGLYRLKLTPSAKPANLALTITLSEE
jgi:hypothetical protein